VPGIEGIQGASSVAGNVRAAEIVMGHRAAVYTVRVHRRSKRTDYRLLGDIDNRGSSLLRQLDKYMIGLKSDSADHSRVIRALSHVIDGDELQLMLQHGQNGIAADIVTEAGELRIHQEPSDMTRVRSAVLMQLPAAETLGWMAVHNNNNHYVKGLLMQALTARFRHDFPDLILDVSPYVLGSVFREAVERDRVEKVTLVKLERPSDRANADTDKWVQSDLGARVQLGIEPRGRDKHLIPGLLQRFLGGDRQAYEEIVVFQGLTFDEAKVQVRLENGALRTFNIERPDAGHAFTEDLRGLQLQDNGEPTEASLIATLRAALSTVAP
jgi:hypothetical protein